MGNNEKIATIFYEIADILEFKNIAWKPIAYRRAAQSIGGLEKDVAEIYREEGLDGLKRIPNIGEKIGQKIVDYLKTGKITEYEKLKSSFPKKISSLMKIPGLGPRRIKKLSSQLNISSLNQLSRALEKHKISELRGFGEKSEKDMQESIRNFKQSDGKRYPRKAAEKEARKIVNKIKKSGSIERIDIAGSLRRKKSTIGDIDILIMSKNPDKTVDVFTKMKEVGQILARGPTKVTVILKSGIQVDIRILPREGYGAGLIYFTGDKNYNIYLRRIAIEKGYRLNEYGLFDRKTGKIIAGKTEEEVLKKLGLKYLRPEEREI